jgi:AcrR family transcriptional regulator
MQEERAHFVTELDDLWPPSAVAVPRRSGAARHARQRREKTLTREEIVKAAVALADAEGAAAVNMRRIARELDAAAMSLYWHVADKEQLLDLMLDVVEGESGIAELSGDWRVDFKSMARQRRRALLSHPWVLDFMSGRAQPGPNGLLQIERSLSVLDGLHLDTRTALQILMTIDTYVTGSVMHEVREIRIEERQASDRLSSVEFAAEMRDWRERLDRSGMFARVVRVFDEGIDPDAAETRDERFEFGLACVLDGLAARLFRQT